MLPAVSIKTKDGRATFYKRDGIVCPSQVVMAETGLTLHFCYVPHTSKDSFTTYFSVRPGPKSCSFFKLEL